ncbi:TolC family protein [Pleomorphovibrio marinus]|uniref:TolC family protein n=1 Tax=Pleomorphovibrio marinus TaxID=2164132 RepID=UPI000E0A44DD|nr:TolC family protein [Pleomorphovibrio marinus]
MKKPLIICVLMGCVLGKNFAQDTIPFTFDQAVKHGLSKNVNLLTLQNQQDLLTMERRNAQLSHLPDLNVNTAALQTRGQQFQQVEGQLIVVNQVNNIIEGGLNARMPVYNGGLRIKTTKASQYFEEAGKHGLSRASQELTFNVSQQYLQVLLDEELYRIALENLENQKKQLEQIEGFVEAGLRTLSDLYNQQSEVARLETVALEAKIQWETDLWELAETLQLEPNQVPLLTPVKMEKVESMFFGRDLEELYDLAYENRPDLAQQKLLEEGNHKMLAASRSAMLPQLNAFFNYNTFFTSLDERGIRDQLAIIYPRRTYGFSLNIPIFNNFSNKVEVARRKVSLQNQQLERGALERRVAQETKLAYENYRAAIKREEATKVQLSAADEAQQAISERFRLGVSNFVDLSQANQQLVTAQSAYAQAQFTLYFQEVMLRFALGILEVDL